MSDRSDPITGLIFRLMGRFGTSRCISRVEELIHQYQALNDSEVLAACRALIEAPKVLEGYENRRHTLSRIAGRKLNDHDAASIAIGCEAFARFPPAGITPGTHLYPEQVQAAVHLVHGSLVQMDTGEGKTFALMVAALALLRMHSQIYVVTANPYLAMRDAGITAPYWAALGIRVGVVLPDYYEATGWPAWDATVVYTTATSLIFRCMEDDMRYQRAGRQIWRGALLVDEADAILLDQLSSKFIINRSISGGRKDWQLACEIAMLLGEEDIKRDPRSAQLEAYLTAAGQSEVVRLSGSTLDDSQHLQLYRDIELAYAGLREAVEGRDYEIIDDTVVPIDPKSGWRTLNSIPDWVAPLASYRGLRHSMRQQTLHMTDGLATLLRFDHFAGASGTLIHEAIDYLLTASLPTVAIPPRKPRYKGMEPDLYFGSLEGVEKYLCDVVADQSIRRPILIVTSSSVDAYHLAAKLRAAVPGGVTVQFAVGDTFGEQKLFEQAGQAGMVVVSTRQAGRGVDIQLDEEARLNGGSMLILVGHAVQARLDRQLLGRVGRGGDPYIAYFCNHPTDGMLSLLGRRAQILRFGAGDEYLESRTITRAIIGFQRSLRRIQLRSFALNIVKSEADAKVFDMLQRWWGLAQDSFDNWSLTAQFLDTAAQTYLSYHTPGIEGSSITESQASIAAGKVMVICGSHESAKTLELRLVGQDAETARSILVTAITTALQDAEAANLRAIQDWRLDFDASLRASRGIEWLSALRRRVDALSRGMPENSALAANSRLGLPEVSYAKDFDLRASPLRSWIREARSAPPTTKEQLDNMSFSPDIDSLHPLMIAALSLRRGDSTITPELLAALSQAIVRAEESLRPLVSRFFILDQNRVFQDRTPAEIVHETIALVAGMASKAQDRLSFDLWQRQMSGTRYQNAYQSGMEDIRKVCEAALAEQVCRNLSTGADLSALDDLFAAYEDRTASSAALRLPVGFASQFVAPTAALDLTRHVPQSNDDLIAAFTDAMMAQRSWRRPQRREDLVPALYAVLKDSPTATLSNPEGVAEAINRWRRHPVRRRLLPWRRHRVDWAVREFLKYLYDQGLSARLPSGIHERTLPLRRRIAARLKAPGMQLGALLMLATLAITAALAFVHIHPPLKLSGVIQLANLCLTAGCLGSGLAIGVALMALTGTAVIKWLINGFDDTAGIWPFERVLVVVLSLAATLGVTLIGNTSWFSAAVASAILIGSSLLLANVVWNLENLGRVRVTAGLISVSIFVVALPALSRDQPHMLILAVAALGALCSVVWRLLPVRLPVNSMQWSDASSDTTEIARGSRTINTHVDWTAHAYALIAGSLVGVVTGFVAWISPIVYLLVYLAWTSRLTRSVTRVDRWVEQLRKVEQGYAKSAKRPDLAAGLSFLRRQFFIREAGIGTIYVALAVALVGSGRLFGGPNLQLGLLAGFLGLAGAELGIAAASSVRNIGGFERAGANLEDADSLSETMISDIRDVLGRFTRRLGLIVLIYLALAKLTEIIGVWELIRSFIEHLHKLF